MGLVRLNVRLLKMLHPNCGFPFYGSLVSVPFVYPFMGLSVKGLLGTWTLFPWMCYLKKKRKWAKFACMAAFLNFVSQMLISYVWQPRVYATRTPTYGSIDARANLHTDPNSMNMLVEENDDWTNSAVW